MMPRNRSFSKKIFAPTVSDLSLPIMHLCRQYFLKMRNAAHVVRTQTCC